MSLELHQFKKENIPELLQFAYASYSDNHPSFVKGLVDFQQFNADTKKLAHLFVQASERLNSGRQNKILYNNYVKVGNKIASVALSCDVDELIKVVRHQIKYEEFQKLPFQYLGKVGRGKAIFGIKATVRKDYMKLGIFQKHIQLRTAHFVKSGIELGYGWTFNPIVMKSMRGQFENKVVADYQGSSQPGYLLQLDLKRHKAKPSL